jgi:surface carbohydrate biosynthesis protein
MSFFLMPIETVSREFFSKLLLAHRLADLGHASFLGEKGRILKLSSLVSPAVYIDKGFHKGVSERIYKRLRKKNIQIVSLDEENAVDFGDYQQLDLRFPSYILKKFDLIFLWGKSQYKFLKKNRVNFDAQKIFTTGHPRFDLLKVKYNDLYKDKVQIYKKRYGNFILINTNFGLGNNINPDKELIKIYSSRFPQINELIQYQRKQVKNFILLAKQISAHTNHIVIFRPHPEESHKIYENAFSSHPKIKVLYQGSVVPWILASEIMIHHDCTTALEAAMMGKASIAYTKSLSPSLTTRIPLEVSYNVSDSSKILKLIKIGLDNRRIHKGLLNSFFSFNLNSTELITKKLSTLVKNNMSNYDCSFVYNLHSLLIYIKYIFFKPSRLLFEKKFSDFDFKVASDVIEKLNSIHLCSVKIKKVDNFLFKIS